MKRELEDTKEERPTTGKVDCSANFVTGYPR